MLRTQGGLKLNQMHMFDHESSLYLYYALCVELPKRGVLSLRKTRIQSVLVAIMLSS